MNWVQENKFLTGWLAIVGLITALLGFLLFKSFTGYKGAINNFNTASSTVMGLEKQVPYPNEENLAKKGELVADYSSAVTDLQKKLTGYQRPLKRLSEIEFQNKLKRSVEAIKSLASNKGATLPENFSLGMSRYITGLPKPEACPLLDFQLESLDFLANLIVESEVASLDVFERKLLPIESGVVPDPEKPKPVLRRFPVEISFTAADQQAVESIINGISNAPPENFYHIIRLVRIENEQKMGPPKTEFSAPAPVDDFSDFASIDGLVGAADTAPDAHYVLGEENLKVFLSIELLHFLEPAVEEAAPAATTGEPATASSN